MTAPLRPTASGRGPQEAAEHIVRALWEAGHEAYFAGGCVRDRIMARTPKDFDVATAARPEEVQALFPRGQQVGEAFGVMLVRHAGHAIEVATFRTEGVYADGRHPSEVSFSDAEHDARRRDFTINGLFEDPRTGEIIDHVDGRADIRRRVVRAIGDPEARLCEDRLRMLRAVRFAAMLEFSIDSATADAIRRGASDLEGVSRERIGQEVTWMLTDPNRALAAWEMQYLGLDRPALREANILEAPRRVGRLPEQAAFPTALAAWLLDRHKDQSGEEAMQTGAKWASALVLSGADTRALQRCLSTLDVLRSGWSGLGVAAQKRMAASDGFDQAVMLLQSEDTQAFVDVRRRVVDLSASGLAPSPLITGDDLIALGFEPGPTFRRILDAVYDAQLEGSTTTRSEALALAEAVAATDGGSPGAAGKSKGG